ncbi:MAG: ATP-dependent DNA ligase [Bacillota bacterium]|nr:MAG: ATP-dependent DNA ligase [Bacillota bacterium]
MGEGLKFGEAAPMLAQTAPEPFDGRDWLFEVKWDGYRALAFLDRGKGTRLQSRRLRDLTASYPDLAGLHGLLESGSAVVDGELVALRDGRPDFQTLQGGGRPVLFVAFDLLQLEDDVLLHRPLAERRRLLEERLGQGPELVHSGGVVGAGVEFHRAAVDRGLEGTVAKRLDSLYYPGRRTRDWLKVRNVHRGFALALGYTRAADARPIGALTLGVVDEDGVLVYAGHAGTGFDEREARRLVDILGPPAGCPLRGGTPRELRGRTTWVNPRHVVEVEFLEWTRDRRFRHPVYRGLRPDKDAADCRMPEVGVR